MDGGATAFYFYMAATAAGTAVTVSEQVNANKRRQMVLEQELRSNELAALDEENQRLMGLRLANEEITVGAGGIDAWASPSLIAARHFNFQMGMEDITNIRTNLAATRAGISAKISMLKSNSRASILGGIFDLAGIAANTAYGAKQLGKTKLDAGVLSEDGLLMSPVPKSNNLTVLGPMRKE
jgi:hypothetical protein